MQARLVAAMGCGLLAVAMLLMARASRDLSSWIYMRDLHAIIC